MSIGRTLFLSSTILSLCGCQTLPRFTDFTRSQPVGPRVSDVTNEVQCEILKALYESAPDRSDPVAQLAPLQNGQYVANVNLTLDVTDNQGVNPALSYIDPFHTVGTNFTASLSGQVSGQQHRNLNVTFTLLFDRNTPTTALNDCHDNREKGGLRGNLGIAEIFATGLAYEVDSTNAAGGYAYKLPAIGVNTLLGTDPLTGSAALAPNFGSTVDFTLIYGVNGGPNWTLTNFTGPSAASGGLLNVLRTNRDTLVLSFARVTPTAPPPANASAAEIEDAQRRASAAIQASAKAAQDNVTRMILQRLLTP